VSTGMRRGLIVALIHVALVASLGAKLQIDRVTRPRVWARTVPVDPDSPLRGRYVRLRVQVEPEGSPGLDDGIQRVRLAVHGQSLGFALDPGGSGGSVRKMSNGPTVLDQPLAFFIPEHVPDPSIRQPGEELWVEVTVPKAGAPRPIRLGVKKDGVITPLELD
jgi:hypothetical protein